MKVVGGGQVHVYQSADEGPHPSGPQELWQESVVLLWWDAAQSIGGFYRIGHETNHPGGPMVTLWSNTFSPQGHFKKTTYLPLRPQDRLENGFGSGDSTHAFQFDDNCVWTIQDDEISAKLRVHDFHPSIDCYPKKGQLAEFAPHHMEVAGRVTGSLSVKGVEYQVNALCFRDHGWGERAWHTLLSHRWLVGVFGPELSFCAISWHSVDDILVQFGWVVRGNEVTYAKHVDILAYVECDALCTRGGRLCMTLTTGEALQMDFEPLVPSAISFHHDIACVDTLSRVRCGAREGIANFETTNNALHGKRRPGKLSRGVIDDGWHLAAASGGTAPGA